MDNTFGKSRRLLRKADYQRVLGNRIHNASYHSTHFVLVVQPAVDAKLGLAISKKHAKTAVLRNHIKRHARECFRHAPFGHSVLLAKKKIMPASYHAEIVALFFNAHCEYLANQIDTLPSISNA